MPSSHFAPQIHHPDFKTFVCVRCFKKVLHTEEKQEVSEISVLTINEKGNPVPGYLDNVGCYDDLAYVKALAIGESIRLGFHQGEYIGVIITRIH